MNWLLLGIHASSFMLPVSRGELDAAANPYTFAFFHWID